MPIQFYIVTFKSKKIYLLHHKSLLSSQSARQTWQMAREIFQIKRTDDGKIWNQLKITQFSAWKMHKIIVANLSERSELISKMWIYDFLKNQFLISEFRWSRKWSSCDVHHHFEYFTWNLGTLCQSATNPTEPVNQGRRTWRLHVQRKSNGVDGTYGNRVRTPVASSLCRWTTPRGKIVANFADLFHRNSFHHTISLHVAN